MVDRIRSFASLLLIFTAFLCGGVLVEYPFIGLVGIVSLIALAGHTWPGELDGRL